MKCLKLIFCLLYLCCSLACKRLKMRVNSQKEVDEMTQTTVWCHFLFGSEGFFRHDEPVMRVSYETPDGSFPDLDYVTVHEGSFYPAGSHLKRLKLMAIAYRKPGNKYYNSGRLLKQIVAGIEL